MVKLASAIIDVIVDEYGVDELLNRLSNPFWLQSLGCALGYDWHSSGLTTVVTGVLKMVLKPSVHGVSVAGGKGAASRKTPSEISRIGEEFGFSTRKISELIRASRLTAKVDNSLIQDGYSIYHHAFIVSEKGGWVVIQQGMNVVDKTARRYHWNSGSVKSFVDEPHESIVGEKSVSKVLNLVAKESEDCRRVSVDLVKDGVRTVKSLYESIVSKHQSRLTKWISEHPDCKRQICEVLYMPRRLNWDAVKRAYEFQPRSYEELIEVQGLGASTLRGLALIAEIVYGCPLSWRDPVKYSFAFGGKDGVPFPIDKAAMDEAIEFMKSIMSSTEVDGVERRRALRRLATLTTHLHRLKKL